MNKKRYYYLLAPAVLLMAGVAMSGCSDRDEAAPQVTAKAGEPILFGIADTQSRTHYTEDKYQIDWDVYDKIGIYSDNAVPGSELGEKSFAYYMINHVYSDTDPVHDYHGDIVPVANKDVVEITEGEGAPSLDGEKAGTYGLMWGKENTFSEEYTFYGAYPACRITKSPADDSGYFTMEYHTNQTVTVESVSNGVYTTKPDMLNAYMMAEKKIYPREDHILLDFDPIMTTLDIHITAGGYELGTGIINPVTITGVSVMMPGALANKALRYKVAEGTQGGAGSSIRLSDVNTSQKESVFVGIDNYGKRYVDLFEGESISLLAFLPPMDMKTGVKIKVHAVGALNFEVTVNKEMIRQGRIDIQLPDVKPSSEIEQAALQTNNWISQLDGNLKLKQLSIPGYELSSADNGEDVEKMLRMGVRAFDMDSDFAKNRKSGQQYELASDITDVLKDFFGEKSSSKNEFIIIWLHDGGALRLKYNEYLDEHFSGKWISPDEDDFNQSIENYHGKIIAVKKNTFYYHYFNKIYNRSTDLGRDDYCRWWHIGEDEEGFRFNGEWGAQFIQDVSWNKDIYEIISNESDQSGHCTGILVLPPNSGEIYYNNAPTYGDLLIQSVIDCNYKFILDRN